MQPVTVATFFWPYKDGKSRRIVRIDNERMDAVTTDPDAFTPHGCPAALDRWADDGGQVL